MLPPAAVVSMHNARSLAYDAGDIRSEISGKMGPFRAANARRIGIRSSAEPVAATASNASVSMAAMSAEPSISATGRPASMSGPIADLILAATATTLLPVDKACTACANAASAVRPRHRTRPFLSQPQSVGLAGRSRQIYWPLLYRCSCCHCFWRFAS